MNGQSIMIRDSHRLLVRRPKQSNQNIPEPSFKRNPPRVAHSHAQSHQSTNHYDLTHDHGRGFSKNVFPFLFYFFLYFFSK